LAKAHGSGRVDGGALTIANPLRRETGFMQALRRRKRRFSGHPLLLLFLGKLLLIIVLIYNY
jgi:murein endopeptidase